MHEFLASIPASKNLTAQQVESLVARLLAVVSTDDHRHRALCTIEGVKSAVKTFLRNSVVAKKRAAEASAAGEGGGAAQDAAGQKGKKPRLNKAQRAAGAALRLEDETARAAEAAKVAAASAAVLAEWDGSFRSKAQPFVDFTEPITVENADAAASLFGDILRFRERALAGGATAAGAAAEAALLAMAANYSTERWAREWRCSVSVSAEPHRRATDVTPPQARAEWRHRRRVRAVQPPVTDKASRRAAARVTLALAKAGDKFMTKARTLVPKSVLSLTRAAAAAVRFGFSSPEPAAAEEEAGGEALPTGGNSGGQIVGGCSLSFTITPEGVGILTSRNNPAFATPAFKKMLLELSGAPERERGGAAAAARLARRPVTSPEARELEAAADELGGADECG